MSRAIDSFPLFSLVLATVGRTDQLERLITSLAIQTEKNFELLLIDQNTDQRVLPSVAMAQAAGIQIEHYVLQPANLSAARNYGIQLARGRIIAFPDDDCWYEPDTLQRVADYYRAGHSLQSGVVVRWAEQTPVAGPPVKFSLACSRRFRDGPASSISLFLPQPWLLQLHGFDPRLGVGQWYGAGEETDLMLRLLRHGVEITSLPGAVVHHAFGGGPKNQAQIRSRARGTGALYIKNGLAPATIFRGLIAPLLLPVLKPQSGRNILQGWADFSGRLQGLLLWTLKHGRDQ